MRGKAGSLGANSIMAWDISTARIVQSVGVAVIQEILPEGIFFKPDGLKMYVAGNEGNRVNEYSLSTAWDISTTSYTQGFSVLAQTTTPSGVFFKSDGEKMYVCSYNGYVYEYSLSSAWDISTASYATSLVVEGEGGPADIFFAPDGLKMYVIGNTSNDVIQYSLGAAWSISTASYVQGFSVASQDTNPKGLFFKPDGLKMYMTGLFNDDVNEYSLSTAWDISTAAYVQSRGFVGEPEAVFFRADGLKMYVIDSAADWVREYNIGKQ